MKTHPFNWIATIIFVIAAGIWLFTNYGLVHSKHLEEAVITGKSHTDDGYFVIVDDKKLHVKDTSTWMLLEEGETYNLTYEWYGIKKPYVKEVNQPHDDDQVGGH
ncbi:hypothetical protein QRD89_17105 [Halobacillus sp. ACCC02827]|uniref:hypothetical protein n=1 Tax=Bacillaceae TaxID=186817 RepID=UPI0002A4E0A5|nr:MULTISPECIES: hypothetical protein [Bacillaceae]ELK49021.1 hypothetical protein D479_00285 [Halobacillus sp. BAB-2008]QHT48185.1 hypothetical protein M662_17425 [Bacillus sp. SB49]WJE15418.1 hypothetical protein QRD89_17105 [Halobacillus sp. ACCC02827]